MKVFLEGFSLDVLPQITEAVPGIELVDTKEESEFWFTPTTPVEEVISILVDGVELEDEEDISEEDLQQKKA